MPTNVHIKPSRTILSTKKITTHFNNPQNIKWVKLEHLLQDTLEQCVDGRSSEGIIGTPGGNMGEFILALDAAEKVTDVWIRPNEVFYLFDEYLKRFGAFYMHTDTHALEHLLQDVNKDKLFSGLGLKTVSDMEKLIRKPAKKYQASLLEHLTQPANTGCGHLKLMLLHKNEYQVRITLIKTAVRAFFSALWRGEDLSYVVLKADHQEGAIITVLVEDANLTPETMIPTVASMGKDMQMFISHPQVAAYMRQMVAKEITSHELIYAISDRNQTEYLETIVSRGQDLARYTLSHLAMGLPNFTVNLSQA